MRFCSILLISAISILLLGSATFSAVNIESDFVQSALALPKRAEQGGPGTVTDSCGQPGYAQSHPAECGTSPPDPSPSPSNPGAPNSGVTCFFGSPDRNGNCPGGPEPPGGTDSPSPSNTPPPLDLPPKYPYDVECPPGSIGIICSPPSLPPVLRDPSLPKGGYDLSNVPSECYPWLRAGPGEKSVLGHPSYCETDYPLHPNPGPVPPTVPANDDTSPTQKTKKPAKNVCDSLPGSLKRLCINSIGRQ